MELPAGKNPYTTLSHELMHSRAYITFYRDMVRVNGIEKDYSYTGAASGVAMVAINEKGEVALVGQWRYPVNMYTWELPAGTREEGEEPLVTGKRELLEEAGASAEEWTPLGAYLVECSKSSQESYIFLAEKLTVGKNNPDEDEGLELLWIPFEKALTLVESGEIHDALSVIGLLRAERFLRRRAPKQL